MSLEQKILNRIHYWKENLKKSWFDDAPSSEELSVMINYHPRKIRNEYIDDFKEDAVQKLVELIELSLRELTDRDQDNLISVLDYFFKLCDKPRLETSPYNQTVKYLTKSISAIESLKDRSELLDVTVLESLYELYPNLIRELKRLKSDKKKQVSRNKVALEEGDIEGILSLEQFIDSFIKPEDELFYDDLEDKSFIEDEDQFFTESGVTDSKQRKVALFLIKHITYVFGLNIPISSIRRVRATYKDYKVPEVIQTTPDTTVFDTLRYALSPTKEEYAEQRGISVDDVVEIEVGDNVTWGYKQDNSK